MGELKPDQLDRYREAGFVVVPGLLDRADLERWSERLDALIEGRVQPAPRTLLMRDVMVVKGKVEPGSEAGAIAKIQDFENDPVLDGYCQHVRVVDCVEQILGPDIQTIHCMLINKPPGVDGRHPLHQDLVYFPFRPADLIVASWTALEPVNRDNGCLALVPGSHRGPLFDHENMDWEDVNQGYWGARGVGAHPDRVHLEMEPGDTVFFHPLILHGSGRNRSAGFRRAISCHYASTRCEKIWDQTEVPGDARWYRTIRGHVPEYTENLKGRPRPGQPELRFPGRSTRRA